MKKYLALILAALLTITAVVGGTIAYFTDEEQSAHVYTVGNIDIDQHEYERNAKGELEKFSQNKPAFPSYYGALGLTEAPTPDTEYVWTNGYVGSSKLWNEKVTNVVDKFVFVENEGKNEAFFRTIIAYELPVGVDDSKVILNLNNDGYYTWETIGTTLIDGVQYKIIVATAKNLLAKGEMSAPSLLQAMFANNMTSAEGEAFGEGFDILVATQAVQIIADDLTADESLNEAFGEITTAAHPWAEKFDALEGAADEEIEENADGAYVIKTAEELLGFAQLVNAGDATMCDGKTVVKLAADINLGGIEWTPIGGVDGSKNYFWGTFDGQGHTIYNLTVNGEKGVGLFGVARADIKNLTIKNVTVTGYDYAGDGA